MISADALSFRRAGRLVLDRVDLRLRPGRVTVAIGPNGAGKSTLMKLLCGELRPDGGEVAYGGRPIRGRSPAALARERAVLPQGGSMPFAFTVHEIVRIGAVAGGDRMPDRGAARALAAVGMEAFTGRRYDRLSGGEQQRVQFARVLAQAPVPAAGDGPPRAVFLDEPTASLDLAHQIGILSLARRHAEAGGIVFAVLHDLNLAAEFADEMVVLHRGRVAASGPPSRSLFERVVDEVYGVAGAASRPPAAGVPFVLPQVRAGGRCAPARTAAP